LAGIKAQLPYLATKSEVSDLKASISEVKASISDQKSSVIQWTVGTIIAVTAVVFSIAKFVH
jgi:phosphoenolpyruvate-protein kinase (PTS system EI component)